MGYYNEYGLRSSVGYLKIKGLRAIRGVSLQLDRHFISHRTEFICVITRIRSAAATVLGILTVVVTVSIIVF